MVLLFCFWLSADGFLPNPNSKLPYLSAGLSDLEAAQHLVNRLTFGAGPGDVETMLAMGLEVWFEKQLQGRFNEINSQRWQFPFLKLDLATLNQTYPSLGKRIRMAQRDGIKVNFSQMQNGDLEDKRVIRRALRQYSSEKGFGNKRQLTRELASYKLNRARYAENQLQEVLVDFWSNHFTVSADHPQAGKMVIHFQEAAIRPFVTGHFQEMLKATAKHPAMLTYLDNAVSVANPGRERMWQRPGVKSRGGSQPNKRKQINGFNENYARELLELHTVGIEAGYSQQDVEAVARIFTGWTVLPSAAPEQRMRFLSARAQRVGFVTEGDFLFRPDWHDSEAKIVFGKRFSGGGLEEGHRLLGFLANHPSTAKRLAKKLCQRFVADDPPVRLVEAVAQSFLETKGNLKEMVRTMVYHPEFWKPSVVGNKLKSPFEIMISVLRAGDMQIHNGNVLASQLRSMGHPINASPSPAGFSETSDGWLSPGALSQRFVFLHRLVKGDIGGVGLGQVFWRKAGMHAVPFTNQLKAQFFIAQDLQPILLTIQPELEHNAVLEQKQMQELVALSVCASSFQNK